jgi:pimeloyl-ACP methyl ester carboxylesterase
MDRGKRIRFYSRLALIIALALFALYILLPAGFGLAVTLPASRTVGPPPEGFEAVSFETSDGVTLAGWYMPPANGAVIVLLHGAGGSREDTLPYAGMLARHGYGVLAVDQRGHGASGGKTNQLGWQGTKDVGAAIQYLQSRPEVERIGGLGISMGGEALLGAASSYPQLTAIAADGASRRSVPELLALPSERPLLRNFTTRVMYGTAQLLSGEHPPLPLLESMQAAQKTHFLLIAAGANELEMAFNELFAKTLGERVDLWVAPATQHTQAFKNYPQEYEKRLVRFFDENLQP